MFLYCAHDRIKGVLGSKIFEYIKFGKPVILCPSDNDELESILNIVGIGYPCNTFNDAFITLSRFFDEFLSNNCISVSINESNRNYFSREHQTKLLAEVFGKILDTPIKPKIKTTNTFRDTSFKVMYNLKFHKVINPSIFNKATIVCFHNISDEPNRAYPPLKIKEFEKLIYYIYKNYRVIKLSQINQTQESSKPKIVLTFDDGYKDFIENALPILKRYELPAIQSIVVDSVETGLPTWTQRLNAFINYLYENEKTFTVKHEDFTLKYNPKGSFKHFNQALFKYLLKLDKIEREKILVLFENEFTDYKKPSVYMMNWDDLKYCLMNNIQIASHTLSHDSLITIDDNDALSREIFDSKKIIEEKLNIKVNTFTFPNGLYNNQTIDLCKKSGYKYLFTTKEKILNPQIILENEYPILIPRININKATFEENVFKMHNFHNLFRWHKE